MLEQAGANSEGFKTTEFPAAIASRTGWRQVDFSLKQNGYVWIIPRTDN